MIRVLEDEATWLRDPQLPSVVIEQSCERFQQGGLSAPVGPQQHPQLALRNCQGGAFQDLGEGDILAICEVILLHILNNKEKPPRGNINY